MVNPFPLARHGRAHPHHNPMDPFRSEHAGLYRPRLARRLPRQIPDEMFTKVFAALRSDCYWALVAFWRPGRGARAAELLGSTAGDPDPARQVISVVRKGSRAIQEWPRARMCSFTWRCISTGCRGRSPLLPMIRCGGRCGRRTGS